MLHENIPNADTNQILVEMGTVKCYEDSTVPIHVGSEDVSSTYSM
jgi:hypothetical protein